MAFDIDTWKAKVQERLQGWKGRIARAGADQSVGMIFRVREREVPR